MQRRRFRPEEIIGKLRKAVSDLTLDKLILQEAARGNFWFIRGMPGRGESAGRPLAGES